MGPFEILGFVVLVQHGCLEVLTHSSSFAPSWRTFVEMPDGMRFRPAFAKIGSDLGSKMVHPAAHRLIGNQDPTLSQQILDVAEAQGLVIIDGYG